MNNSEGQVIQKFREWIGNIDSSEEVKIIYRVEGGMPSERIETELTLYGNGEVHVKKQDMLGTAIPMEASSELQPVEAQELFQEIADGIDGLVPRSEARFLPDSLVGTVTIDINGETETLYFLAEEDERLAQESQLSPQMDRVFQRIDELLESLLLNGEVSDE